MYTNICIYTCQYIYTYIYKHISLSLFHALSDGVVAQVVVTAMSVWLMPLAPLRAFALGQVLTPPTSRERQLVTSPQSPQGPRMFSPTFSNRYPVEMSTTSSTH